MRIVPGSRFLKFCCEISTKACAQRVVLSEGSGRGLVLHVEHSGSSGKLESEGRLGAGVSEQQGGGPAESIEGGGRGRENVLMSIKKADDMSSGRKDRSGLLVK
jgi:hypothetical protein